MAAMAKMKFFIFILTIASKWRNVLNLDITIYNFFILKLKKSNTNDINKQFLLPLLT